MFEVTVQGAVHHGEEVKAWGLEGRGKHLKKLASWDPPQF